MIVQRRLVLVGAGHAHAQVLLDLIRQPLTGVEVVLVSPYTLAPYSGRVPAWLAGDHAWRDCCVDFNNLCERAGVRLVIGEVTAIDPAHHRLQLAPGVCLDYGWLSLNIGSTLTPPGSAATHGVQVVPMRPLTALQERWEAVLERVGQMQHPTPSASPIDAALAVVVVGGGAAGIESVLAAHHRLTTLAPQVRFTFTLATQGATLTTGLAPAAGTALMRHLKARGIAVHTGFAAQGFAQGAVVDAGGNSLAADVVLWATGAQAFAWTGAGGLATDARGFVRIDAGLRSVSHPNVFASGDCASWDDALHDPLPKAGVYAVRMGPVLSANLRAAVGATVGADTSDDYAPQRRYLVLIGTGDHHAVASWGRFSWQGDWVYRWKQRIDQRFLNRFMASASGQSLHQT